MELKQLLTEKPATAAKQREFAGWKLKLTYRSQAAAVTTDLRYAKVEAEPLIDLESEVKKLNRETLRPVKEKWSKTVVEIDESGQERPIDETLIGYFQEIDGQLTEVSKLERTNEVEVNEEDQNCTIEDKKAYGTTIPISQVLEYVTESTYEVWGEDSTAKMLAEVLEKEGVALLFPFTFGAGFKIYTATLYPIRIDGNLHLIMNLNTGRRILKHPLTAAAAAVAKKPKPILAKPKLKVKAK